MGSYQVKDPQESELSFIMEAGHWMNCSDLDTQTWRVIRRPLSHPITGVTDREPWMALLIALMDTCWLLEGMMPADESVL
jgi:hypothetical protein